MKYHLDKLAYYENYLRIEEAISEEKRIKAGSRIKKIRLIENKNPGREGFVGRSF